MCIMLRLIRSSHRHVHLGLYSRVHSTAKNYRHDQKHEMDYLGLGLETSTVIDKIKHEEAEISVDLLEKSLSSRSNVALERYIPTTFGSIRLDRDNVVDFHGQFDDVDDLEMTTVYDHPAEFADRAATNNLQSNSSNLSSHAEHLTELDGLTNHPERDSVQNCEDGQSSLQPPSLNNINENRRYGTSSLIDVDKDRHAHSLDQSSLSFDDRNCVGPGGADDGATLASLSLESDRDFDVGGHGGDNSVYSSQDDYSINSEQYDEFPQDASRSSSLAVDGEHSLEHQRESSLEGLTDNGLASSRTPVRDNEHKFVQQDKITDSVAPLRVEESKKKEDKVKSRKVSDIKRKEKVEPSMDNASGTLNNATQSAVDVVKNIRSKQAKTEAGQNRGKQLLSEAPALWKMSTENVVELLFHSVLHNDDQLLVLNKPYGLPVHSTSKRYPHCLLALLQRLCERLRCQRLYTVHRLDRDTTGALMLAKTADMARRIQKLLEQKRVTKLYWAILRGQLNPHSGQVEVPLAASVSTAAHSDEHAYERMMPCPVLKGVRTNSNAKEAITSFRTLSSLPECTLAELSPLTGVKHQLRTHMGLCVDRPVLGDHKYSQWSRVVPQKLPGGVLRCLGLRQPEVRHIPLHLHSRRLIIEEINVNVIAPLPTFFKKNLKRLKLTPSKH